MPPQLPSHAAYNVAAAVPIPAIAQPTGPIDIIAVFTAIPNPRTPIPAVTAFAPNNFIATPAAAVFIFTRFMLPAICAPAATVDNAVVVIDDAINLCVSA